MIIKIKYNFNATIWLHSFAKGGWYFVSLPKEMSKEIRENLKWQEEGWGRLKATATVKGTTWETAIWFDSKKKTYLFPIKSAIRKAKHLEIDNIIEVMLEI